MAHAIDDLGYPIDPELRRLEFSLGDLVAKWAESGGPVGGAQDVLQAYYAVMERLYALGWDAVLDVESELPTDLMPEEYIRRNGPPDISW